MSSSEVPGTTARYLEGGEEDYEGEVAAGTISPAW